MGRRGPPRDSRFLARASCENWRFSDSLFRRKPPKTGGFLARPVRRQCSPAETRRNGRTGRAASPPCLALAAGAAGRRPGSVLLRRLWPGFKLAWPNTSLPSRPGPGSADEGGNVPDGECGGVQRSGRAPPLRQPGLAQRRARACSSCSPALAIACAVRRVLARSPVQGRAQPS